MNKYLILYFLFNHIIWQIAIALKNPQLPCGVKQTKMIYHNILQTLFTSLIPLILNLAKIPWTFSFYIIYVIVQWLSTFTIHVNFPQSQSGRLVLQEGDWVKKSVIWGVDLSYEWKCRVELAFILFRHFSGQFEVWCNSMESCCHVAFIYHLDTLMPSICLLKFPIDNWQ